MARMQPNLTLVASISCENRWSMSCDGYATLSTGVNDRYIAETISVQHFTNKGWRVDEEGKTFCPKCAEAMRGDD